MYGKKATKKRKLFNGFIRTDYLSVLGTAAISLELTEEGSLFLLHVYWKGLLNEKQDAIPFIERKIVL